MFRTAASALSRAPARGFGAIQRVQQRQFMGVTPQNGAYRLNQQFQQSRFASGPKRKFASATAEEPVVASQQIKKACKSVTDPQGASNIIGKLGLFFVFNPITLGVAYVFHARRHNQKEFTIEDEQNAINMSKGQVAAVRDARRSSVHDYKMQVWGQDPKEHYDEASYRRTNHTTLVKMNSVRPGGEEAAKKMQKKKSNRIGLYDSEGKADASRVSEGLDGYKERMAAQNAGRAAAPE